jgi:hypothetical protein
MQMRSRVIAAVSITTSLLLATAASSFAQSQAPRSGQLPSAGGQRPPSGPAPQQRPQQAPQQAPQQQAAGKPYKAVSITAPEPVKDPSFEAFRKQLAGIAEKKDRKALAGVVAQNFFWMGEKGDKADKKKSGVDNLAKAIGLDGKEAPGWDALSSYSDDPTGSPFTERKDTICAPAEPVFNQEELDALIKATGSDDGDWGYPTQPGVEVHSGAQPNSPVVEKLGMHFVRIAQDEAQNNQQNPMLKVTTPSGKTGFVSADALSPLGNDQVCYSKEGGNWKIAGFIGGDQQ